MENKGWLDDLLDELGWTPADLARETHLDSAVISNIRNGRRDIGIDTAVTISKATKIPPEIILQRAGRFPIDPEADEAAKRVLREMVDLSPQDKAELLAFIRMKKNLRNRR